MLGISAGLRDIAVAVLNHFVLGAVTELATHGRLPGLLGVFWLNCAFSLVVIGFVLCHRFSGEWR